MESYSHKYIATAATTVVSSKDEGILHSIVVGTTAAATITITDNTGTIGVLKASVVEGTYTFDVAYTGHLTVTTAGTPTVTVCYN